MKMDLEQVLGGICIQSTSRGMCMHAWNLDRHVHVVALHVRHEKIQQNVRVSIAFCPEVYTGDAGTRSF